MSDNAALIRPTKTATFLGSGLSGLGILLLLGAGFSLATEAALAADENA